MGLRAAWNRTGDDVHVPSRGNRGQVLAFVVDAEVDAALGQALEARDLINQAGWGEEADLAAVL